MDHRTIAQDAVELVLPAVEKLLRERAKRQHLHIVVMDPTKQPWNSVFEDAVLYEHSVGDTAAWEHEYRKLALCKARQAWRDGRSNLYKHLLAPATLSKGDITFYGSFDYQGVIAASSGIEGWYDVLVSGWVALAFQQLAQDWYQRFKAAHPAEEFIP